MPYGGSPRVGPPRTIARARSVPRDPRQAAVARAEKIDTSAIPYLDRKSTPQRSDRRPRRRARPAKRRPLACATWDRANCRKAAPWRRPAANRERSTSGANVSVAVDTDRRRFFGMPNDDDLRGSIALSHVQDSVPSGFSGAVARPSTKMRFAISMRSTGRFFGLGGSCLNTALYPAKA